MAFQFNLFDLLLPQAAPSPAVSSRPGPPPVAPPAGPQSVPDWAPERASPPSEPRRSPQREVCLQGQGIPYALRRSARRSIGFTISADGLRVSAPRWVAQGEIDAALQAKADWILRKLGQVQARERLLNEGRVNWADGAILPYLGASMQIRLAPQARRAHWEAAAPESQAPHVQACPLGRLGGGVLHLALPEQADAIQIRDATQAWLQGQARGLFEQRCRHFAPLLGVQYTRLGLSSARTRWGSATAQGHIRLNWRLIHLPLASIDYVVAHELAHLREMNHSPRFWAVVESVLPDYQALRGQLRHETLPLWD